MIGWDSLWAFPESGLSQVALLFWSGVIPRILIMYTELHSKFNTNHLWIISPFVLPYLALSFSSIHNEEKKGTYIHVKYY